MKKWFTRLKVSQKLMLISIFFVMPDSLMLYFFVTGINANIRFAQLEKQGNEYQRPLEELLHLIPLHRQLAERVRNGEQTAVQELSKKESEIESTFDLLEKVDARIGRRLQFTDEGLAKRKREHYRVRTVRKEWQELKTALPQLSPELSLEQSAHLRSDVRMMITHAGDMSNLILDPDLDSYYLMDATLLALPQTQDRLATVIAYGETALAQPTISSQQQRQLAIHATALKESDLDRIANSMQTALNEDENFYGRSASLQSRVPSPLKEYTIAAEEFINLTTRLADPEKPDPSAEEYLAAGNQAREASFKLWKIAAEELDTLLQKRIEVYEQRRTKSLMVAALALLAAITFVTFITRSISSPLRKQAADLRIANETLQAEVAGRIRVEAELRRSEAQLATAQEIAGIGSWEWDIPTNRMTWSDENYRLHGFEPRKFEVSYEATLQFIHPDERASSDLTIKRALREGKPFSFEQRVLRPDGAGRIIQQRGDVVLGPDGKAGKMLGTAQDVTERKQAEQELERIHKQLLEAAHRTGMAEEMATGVLHNVGNVLNSVNVASMCMADSLKKSKVAYLSKAVALLGEHETDLGMFLTSDPKGKQVPAYLAKLAGQLAVEHAVALKELDQLQKNIEHVKQVVAVQQSCAKGAGKLETLQATDLVEDALRMDSSGQAHRDIEVIREFGHAPAISVEKHKVLQILMNLVRNARQSCHEGGRLEKRLALCVTTGDDRVRIAVSDNGVGISPENLARIFAHGFTTKKDGHGFGLHSAALAAREMGGSLNAQSDGVGHGARFTLELPVNLAKETNSNALLTANEHLLST